MHLLYESTFVWNGDSNTRKRWSRDTYLPPACWILIWILCRRGVRSPAAVSCDTCFYMKSFTRKMSLWLQFTPKYTLWHTVSRTWYCIRIVTQISRKIMKNRSNALPWKLLRSKDSAFCNPIFTVWLSKQRLQFFRSFFFFACVNTKLSCIVFVQYMLLSYIVQYTHSIVCVHCTMYTHSIVCTLYNIHSIVCVHCTMYTHYCVCMYSVHVCHSLCVCVQVCNSMCVCTCL